MPQPCALQSLGINMSGWVEGGLTFNSLSPSDRWNGPVATNDRSDEYQLNQAWLYFVKPTKTDGCGWDLGGRIDVVYGTDWRFGQCYGLETTFDDPNSFYGLVLPQFYAEVAVDDLTVKGAGRAADHTIGVNWYLTPYTRVMFNYVHSETTDRGAYPIGIVDLVETRVAINF